MTQPTWDETWMGVADKLSERATCPRRSVGAIIVVNNNIESFGYNGAPRHRPHCSDVGCEIEHGHCVRAIHAENNSIIKFDTTLFWNDHSTIYTTASPCRNCMSMIINANINKIVCRDVYHDPTHASNKAQWAIDAAREANIELIFI